MVWLSVKIVNGILKAIRMHKLYPPNMPKNMVIEWKVS